MNKKELTINVSSKTKLSQKSVEEFLKAFIETVEETVVGGESVKIIDFGTFEKASVKGRKGKINGKEWSTEDSFKVKFKIGKLFRSKISNK